MHVFNRTRTICICISLARKKRQVQPFHGSIESRVLNGNVARRRYHDLPAGDYEPLVGRRSADRDIAAAAQIKTCHRHGIAGIGLHRDRLPHSPRGWESDGLIVISRKDRAGVSGHRGIDARLKGRKIS